MRLALAGNEGPLPPAIIEPDPVVVKQVLEFFVHNRKAADTLEGIARWRLLQQEVRRNVQQTEQALGWLVEQGLIEELQPPGYQTSVFRLNPERQEDAVQFLAKQKKNKDKK
ncbi:MAG TPA: hypothetical protein VLK33_20350 [Terriglobales bacterium]|nr:hypothetical protein [Terriglobales bacterium]